MTALVIDGAGVSSLMLECLECFIDAKKLSKISISNYGRIIIDEDDLKHVHDSLVEFEMSRILRNFDIKKILIDSELYNIEILNLQQNNFGDYLANGKIFEAVKEAIKRINLSSANISKLSLETFEGCTKLEHLDLSKNSIFNLPSGIFDDLENLKSLNLQSTQLKFLPNGLFDTQLRTNKLASLNLLDNQWDCDLNILYLKYFLIMTKSEVSVDTCASPPEHAGHAIKDLWCTVNENTINCMNTTESELESTLKMLNMVS